jgi:hypothetical protein
MFDSVVGQVLFDVLLSITAVTENITTAIVVDTENFVSLFTQMFATRGAD